MQKQSGDIDRYWESFRNGEDKAFDQLYLELFPSMSFFAFKIIQHAQHAEDIVQDCFVSIWNRRADLLHVSDLKSYLYRSVQNNCFKYLQRLKKTISSDANQEVPSIERLIIQAEVARELYSHLNKLDTEMRKVIQLYYLEGKGYSEIGQLLNLDPETVRKRKYRALLALRRCNISFLRVLA